jgi:hypothetical protein
MHKIIWASFSVCFLYFYKYIMLFLLPVAVVDTPATASAAVSSLPGSQAVCVFSSRALLALL